MNEDEPRLRETGRGLTIQYRGRHLYSSRDPRSGPRRQARAVRLDPGSLVYVPSLGLGYGLRELLDRLPERCHVLCVEAEPALMALAMGSGVELPRSERLSIVRLDDPGRAAAVLRSLGPWRFRRVAPVPLCSAYQLAPGVYRAIQEALEEELRLFWQNKITMVEMSRLWLRNLFGNLALLPGAAAADSLRSPEPIVVTGAGPSLEGSLEAILRIRRRVRLLAADTSLPALRTAGLRPDWACVLESQVHNLDDFVPAFDPSLTLLCDLTASPTVLHRFPRRAFFATRFHPLELFRRLEHHRILPTPLAAVGSVGVTAVQLALRMTPGPVLLAGLDFSYRPGKTHARGTPAHLAPLRTSRRLRPPGMNAFEALLLRPRLLLPGRTGEQLTSDLVLRSYAVQLQRLVEGSGRVYDLAGAGLPCGAVPLGSRGEIQAVLSRRHDESKDPNARRSREPQGPAFAPSRRTVEDFCRREVALLSRAEAGLLGLLEAAAPSRAPGGTPAPEIPPWLLDTDYLLLPIPEADPGRLLTRPNLARLLTGARYFQRLLERPTPRRS